MSPASRYTRRVRMAALARMFGPAKWLLAEYWGLLLMPLTSGGRR